jgi:hypothetical protein
MPGKKYTFGQPSLMKALEQGQKATLKFLDQPKAVETEWGQKYSVSILLISHPAYSLSPSSKAMKLIWQSSAKVMRDLVDSLETDNKEFNKDYYDMTWELSVADDGSYWLNA